MSKLKQAIAQLISDIKFALQFLQALFFQERLYGYDRAESASISQGICTGDRAPTHRRIAQSGERPDQTSRVQKADYCSSAPTSEFLGFWAGNPRDFLLSPDDSGSASAQPASGANLQDGVNTQQYLGSDRDWDLLDPRDRQAIILAAMWQHQAESEYHVLFSVREVIDLCDRPDMHWDLAYEDLTALKKQSKVDVFEVSTAANFYGFYWGLK